ncbi:MAG TPA: nitrogenase iron-molybdenum cofactor biosynthesis protein NifE, partial [Thermodesulfovibrionales bacterium]|nr:nitrogenase iron-molybdenum cofactor biosynthesis protein NifE [Thermodesulfovibrionales bacterium]
MVTSTGINALLDAGCSPERKDKVCRSRGGESCAFDGAMIVLQPIADTAHIVHGPIACCGNSWEGRGALSSKVGLHRMGFTTDLDEINIVHGSERKLYDAIVTTYETVAPKAIFVYATCVSGLIGEDIESVCRKTEKKLGVPVIPVNAPGFVGPKNLGNRIAGEVLLEYVIGTGEPPVSTDNDINLIGEYNIAGDLWAVEPVLSAAGIRVLSRITGDACFEEITYAHRAKLNVVVCSRALINIAKEMERKYGIPYVEVSFFGKTEMARALRLISSKLGSQDPELREKIEEVIGREEERLGEKLRAYAHLIGKKALLYTGGVKSWSFISALRDLGIEVVGVGTKKSSIEDEEKMKELMGEDAPLIDDVAPQNLMKIMSDRKADVLVAGGRNQYLAVKEGYPFVDVNQERHIRYAGYEGLLNLAEQISNSVRFYNRDQVRISESRYSRPGVPGLLNQVQKRTVTINPLKHSQSIGAAIAFQGIDRAIPVIHGAQGCTFLAKVLLTKHFREPIALMGTKLFTEEVVMGSEECIVRVVEGLMRKQRPDVIGVLTSGLSEVKGDDVATVIRKLETENAMPGVLHVSTPDYEGGLETGYAKAVKAIIGMAGSHRCTDRSRFTKGQINVLAGPHLTPADFTEVREIIESFGLHPVFLPDLSSLDGSREGFSALATGGTTLDEIRSMSASELTVAIGLSMESPARLMQERYCIPYTVFEGISGLHDVDLFLSILSGVSGLQVPVRYARQRRILVDTMRDAHFSFGSKRFCVALDPDLCLQVSRLLSDMGALVELAVLPHASPSAAKICAQRVTVGDFS